MSPPESLTSSWNGPEAPGAFSHHGPSVVPREAPHQDGVPDQASQRVMQHGRRQGRSLGSNSPSPAQSQEMPQPRIPDAGDGKNSRPDSAAYKAKVLANGSYILFNHVFLSSAVPPLLHTPFPITQVQLRNNSWKGFACSIRCHQFALHPSSNLSCQNVMQPWSVSLSTVPMKRGCINADQMQKSMMQQSMMQKSMMQKFVWLQVGGVLAELQAEQARLRQLCSEQAAAMHSLQRQAQQAAK